ncbi:MAG TPA: DUF5939 domain-containing protein, partial [Verrucomicrobiae bacterium]|nr:DUF5939 domain-containing protein [Verrucomicrobiae bacterium]
MIRTERSFELPFACGQLWPILAKTDWINRAIGLPPVHYEITPLREGGTKVMGKAKFFGMALHWEEKPFEWIENDFYHVHRVYEGGPLVEAKLGMVFREHGKARTQVLVFSELTPRHAVGAMISKTLIAPKGDRDMAAVVENVQAFLSGAEKEPIPKLSVSAVAEETLTAGLMRVAKMGMPASLMIRLEAMLREAPDAALAHIRPFAVAREWGEDRWKVLRLFLHATRAGLLDLNWSILCPNCRSSRQPPATTLEDLTRTSHCEVCNIQYDAEFDKSVELRFRANGALRATDPQTFCLGGPGGKPHIVSQILLPPGARRAWNLPELTVIHRLRSPQVKRSVVLTPDAETKVIFPTLILCEPDNFKVVTERGGSSQTLIYVMNPNQHTVQLVLERMAWDEDILTAARVTNWQDFRDLFSAEVLSSREEMSVGYQVIL